MIHEFPSHEAQKAYTCLMSFLSNQDPTLPAGIREKNQGVKTALITGNIRCDFTNENSPPFFYPDYDPVTNTFIPTISLSPSWLENNPLITRNNQFIAGISVASDWETGKFARRRIYSLADALALQLEYQQAQEIKGYHFDPVDERSQHLVAAFQRIGEGEEKWLTAVREYLGRPQLDWDLSHEFFIKVIDEIAIGRDLTSIADFLIEKIQFDPDFVANFLPNAFATVLTLATDFRYFQNIREYFYPYRVFLERNSLPPDIDSVKTSQEEIETELAFRLIAHTVGQEIFDIILEQAEEDEPSEVPYFLQHMDTPDPLPAEISSAQQLANADRWSGVKNFAEWRKIQLKKLKPGEVTLLREALEMIYDHARRYADPVIPFDHESISVPANACLLFTVDVAVNALSILEALTKIDTDLFFDMIPYPLASLQEVRSYIHTASRYMTQEVYGTIQDVIDRLYYGKGQLNSTENQMMIHRAYWKVFQLLEIPFADIEFEKQIRRN